MSDMFNGLTDHAFKEINQTYFLKVVDDILVFGATKDECFKRFEEIICMMKKHGIIMSLKKLQEGIEVKWCGYILKIISDNGPIVIKPDPE